MGRTSWQWAVAMSCALFFACSSGEKPPGGTDAGQIDLGKDDGGQPDAGPPDGGPDGGTDGGTDGGITFGGVGPWPKDNVTYGSGDGINVAYPGVVGFSTDETQNQWVATNGALYLMRPGDKAFRRYDAQDGLHLQSNPVKYCDSSFTGGDRACPIYGGAADPGIAEITGGGPNEVFVGYFSTHDWNSVDEGTWSDPYRHQGKIDRVRLLPDGKLDVARFDIVSNVSVMYWHDKQPYRMVFDHFIHKHELYVGAEHGVVKLSPDKWFPTPPEHADWPYTDYRIWMGDHLHPHVCYHQLCTDDINKDTQMMGGFAALAIDPFDGDLWAGSVYSAGKMRYTENNFDWISRAGAQIYQYNFGDQWCGPSGQVNVWDYSKGGWVLTSCTPWSGWPPVFPVPTVGDYVNINAVTVTPDHKSWWSSSIYGIASFDGHEFRYFSVEQVGASSTVTDLVALPDGRLAIGTQSDGLIIWNPDTGTRTAFRAGAGLPDNQVNRLELDTMVNPPALHVSTAAGATSIRVFP